MKNVVHNHDSEKKENRELKKLYQITFFFFFEKFFNPEFVKLRRIQNGEYERDVRKKKTHAHHDVKMQK